MAGTLFGIPLSQQIGPDGTPASGCLVYVYDANTSTPAVTYSDFGLTTAQTWPLEADSVGRVPAFWVSDGSYRCRITTSAGVELIDEQSITSIGASSSGSSSVDTSSGTGFETGDMIWSPVAGTKSGWVRANGRTIGNGSSGATERANSDCQSLFEWFWNNFSDSFCAVSSGRGASAEADFNAAKTIATLDMRDHLMWGASGMGNTSTGNLSDTAATAVGALTQTLVANNLPTHTHAAGSYSVGTTITNGTTVIRGTLASVDSSSGTVRGVTAGSASSDTISLASGAVSGTGGDNTTTGAAVDITSKGRVGTIYVKL